VHCIFQLALLSCSTSIIEIHVAHMTNQDEGKQFPCNFLGDIYDICMLSILLFCKHTHHKEYMRTTQGIYASDIDSFEKSHIGLRFWIRNYFYSSVPCIGYIAGQHYTCMPWNSAYPWNFISRKSGIGRLKKVWQPEIAKFNTD